MRSLSNSLGVVTPIYKNNHNDKPLSSSNSDTAEELTDFYFWLSSA